MTILAGHGGVHAYQWKVAHIMVKDHLFTPALLVMTALALFALFAFMNIVEAVAHLAFSFVFFLAGITLMAEIASYITVFTFQRVFGLFGVIEFGLAPALYLVTVVALFAIATLVLVVMFVTVDAGSLGEFLVAETVFFPCVCTVTVLAAFA